MATIVPIPTSKGNRKYRWDELMDGQARLLVRGVDYKVSDASFRTAISDKARSAKKVGHAHQVEDGLIVWFE